MIATSDKHSGHEHPRPRSAAVVDDMARRLSALGYRDTEPRRLIISAVAAQDRPFTAEELCASLPCVGRATVYRGLRMLVKSDLVCRVLLKGQELRYELIQPERHHYLLCGICGASTDLERYDAEDILRKAAEAAGFRMSGHWLEVYGQCSECDAD